MSMPYEEHGRTAQKQRTRAALLDAAQRLLSDGATPTVEQVADAAAISRTTAYRYFPNQRALLLAAIPSIDRTSQLPADGAPADVATRLDQVIAAQVRILRDYEPQLRAALLLSLEAPATRSPARRSPLRTGRAIGWIAEALAPLEQSHPSVDRRGLAIAIRAGCGIESWVWLVDVAGLSRTAAARTMRGSAAALLRDALARAEQGASRPQ